jgi:hypothetical protein
MVLTKQALQKVDTLELRLSLAQGLGFTETWVRSLIKANKSNGPLTTEKALRVIEKETGLKRREILEQEPETVGQG